MEGENVFDSALLDANHECNLFLLDYRASKRYPQLDLEVSPLQLHTQPSSDGSTELGLEHKTKSAPRRPIPRKGHTKSRRGCFNCKRRKVKCCESHPTCAHCKKAGLLCEYPKLYVHRTLNRDGDGTEICAESSASGDNTNTELAMKYRQPEPQQIFNSSMHGTPTSFSMLDMRLWHHFLKFSYPHLPVGADKIWVTSVPMIAFEVSKEESPTIT